MVPGLDLFAAHFRDFSNRYVVIGGGLFCGVLQTILVIVCGGAAV